MMSKIISFMVSIIFYLIGTGGLFYFIGWIGGLLPWHPLESVAEVSTLEAVMKNILLLGVFGLQHSIMARKGFKKKWTRIVPRQLERSIYVAISGLLCLLIAWQWAPLDGTLWHIESGTTAFIVVKSLYFIGVVFLLSSSFIINHFELFGLQQAYFHLMGKKKGTPRFVEKLYYRFVRHPIYFGFMLILWMATTMTGTHMMLAAGFTVYIMVGMFYEEKDLVDEFGQTYELYRKRVPQLIPLTKLNRKDAQSGEPKDLQTT